MLRNLFHCELLCCGFVLDFPDAAEPPKPDLIEELVLLEFEFAFIRVRARVMAQLTILEAEFGRAATLAEHCGMQAAHCVHFGFAFLESGSLHF